jgi:hypothetical protein
MSQDTESSTGGRLFGSAIEERRRSIVFAIAMMTGFLVTVSATTLLLAGESVLLVVLLGLCGGLAFVFAGFVFAGRFEGLFADEQLLWQLTE